MHPAVHAKNRHNEFVRLQLETDVLIDLPDDEAGGPTAPHDRYFEFGMRWWVLTCSGVAHGSVSDTTRRLVRPHVDPTLSLEDCIAGMASVLTQLQNADECDYQKMVDGMLRARRHVSGRFAARGHGARSSNGSSCVTPRTRKTRRKHNGRGANHKTERRRNARTEFAEHGLVLSRNQYMLQVHLAESAIDVLRTTPPGNAPGWEPADQDSDIVSIGQTYAVFHHLAIAYMVGGDQCTARVRDISGPFPAIPPLQALAGLQDTRRRLDALDRGQRATAFIAIDFALRWFDSAPQ